MKRIVLFAACMFLHACATMSGPKPDVAIMNLLFTEVTLMETSMELVLRIDNPRSEALVLDGASYRVYLNGTDIGTGMSDETIEVPRLGSATQRVTFRLSNFSMIRKIQSLVESQRFDYRIESNFYVKDFGIRRTLEVTREGRFDVKEFSSPPVK